MKKFIKLNEIQENSEPTLLCISIEKIIAVRTDEYEETEVITDDGSSFSVEESVESIMEELDEYYGQE